MAQIRFFKNACDEKAWESVLAANSNSPQTVNERKKEYFKLFSRYNDDMSTQRQFSGQSEFLISANQLFNATMASYARSFAGHLAIERAMDHAHCTLYFNDLVGVTNNRVVLPNVGKENLNNINAKFETRSNFTASQRAYDITTGKKIIPGSVVLTIIPENDPSKAIVIRDDKKNNLLAPAGILEVGSVDYVNAGRITFTIATTAPFVSNLATSAYTLSLFEDVAGTPDWNGTAHGNNRFKINHNEISVDASPDILIGESDIMSNAQYMKSLGSDPQEILGQKLTELYTKLLNEKLINCIQNNYQGDTTVIDPEKSQFSDFKSRLHAFSAMLTKVDDDLAKKSIKGCQATAYFVGMGLANFFKQCRTTGEFVQNTDSTYINDLVGHFNGIPVYRHTLIGNNDGYAVHKTADGQLAPVIRGIFLPLTNTPVAGSYQNPTQLAQGVYYQEANESIVPEFVQKFTLVA